MHVPHFVGSTWVRIAAAAFALLAAADLVVYSQARSEQHASWLLPAAIILAAAALLGGIHSHAALYRQWMRGAETLGHGVTIILFGVLYLFMVPFFAVVLKLKDPLGLRKGSGRQTFWTAKPKLPVDWDSLQRMG